MIPDDLLPTPAVDRRTLGEARFSDRDDSSSIDGDRPHWRSDRRRARVNEVLRRRQPDLTVVLEDVHDPHNASAILRSCDATGVFRIHTVYTDAAMPAEFTQTTSAGAAKWIEHVHHDSVQTCFDALHREGFTILATALTPNSQNLYALDLTKPVALVFGNEMRGVSDDIIAAADATVFIPMMGMVQSLNVSVASSVALYEALRQRRAVGAYATPKLDDEQLAELEAAWLLR